MLSFGFDTCIRESLQPSLSCSTTRAPTVIEWSHPQFIRIANCPSLVLGISAARLGVGDFPIADLPAVSQSFNTPTQLTVAADQRSARQGRRGTRQTRHRCQDVDDGRPSTVVALGVTSSRRGMAGAQARWLSGTTEYRPSADGRRELALVPLS